MSIFIHCSHAIQKLTWVFSAFFFFFFRERQKINKYSWHQRGPKNIPSQGLSSVCQFLWNQSLGKSAFICVVIHSWFWNKVEELQFQRKSAESSWKLVFSFSIGFTWLWPSTMKAHIVLGVLKYLRLFCKKKTKKTNKQKRQRWYLDTIRMQLFQKHPNLCYVKWRTLDI